MLRMEGKRGKGKNNRDDATDAATLTIEVYCETRFIVLIFLTIFGTAVVLEKLRNSQVVSGLLHKRIAEKCHKSCAALKLTLAGNE